MLGEGLGGGRLGRTGQHWGDFIKPPPIPDGDAASIHASPLLAPLASAEVVKEEKGKRKKSTNVVFRLEMLLHGLF